MIWTPNRKRFKLYPFGKQWKRYVSPLSLYFRNSACYYQDYYQEEIFFIEKKQKATWSAEMYHTGVVFKNKELAISLAQLIECVQCKEYRPIAWKNICPSVIFQQQHAFFTCIFCLINYPFFILASFSSSLFPYVETPVMLRWLLSRVHLLKVLI